MQFQWTDGANGCFNHLLHDNAFYYIFENIMENGAFALGANTPFSILHFP